MFAVPLLWLRRRPDLLLWYLMLLGGVGCVMALDLVRGTGALTLTRYTLVAAAPMYALLAGLLWQIPGRWKHAVAAVLALACLWALPDAYRDIKPHWRAAAGRGGAGTRPRRRRRSVRSRGVRSDAGRGACCPRGRARAPQRR